ncbi:MAG: peptidoglycan editing factor PgeF [Alphaproteobacteria bacterium]
MTKILSQPDFEPLYFEQAGFAGHGVFHGFFSRRGGVSKDIYASLNCGPGSGDSLENVHQNRKTISEIAGCAPGNLLSLHQTHSADCLVVDKPWGVEERPQADAMVSDVPGLALSVLTADCGPVLFRGENGAGKPVIGAAHAGWSGGLKGVLEETLDKMEGLGARRESVSAVIGPCIGQASYEVEEGFAVAFVEEDEVSERFFKAGQKGGHLMFDLPGYLAFRLARAGLKSVYIKDLDTYFNEEDFFSYRRATHRRERGYGRQISVIAIHEN